MSTPFKMKGWSPFTKKIDPKALETFTKDAVKSIEKKGEYTYDASTKSWISTKTGKSIEHSEVKTLLNPKTGEIN